MIHFIKEGLQYANGGYKAQFDVSAVLEKNNVHMIAVDSKKPSNKIKRLLSYFTNKKEWNMELKKIGNGDYVIIQYPVIFTTIGLNSVVKKHSKRINFVLIVHDLDSIRFNISNHGFFSHLKDLFYDKFFLKKMTYIIVHNDKMKDILVKRGISPNRIVTLGLFDYLTSENDYRQRSKNNPIVIAGNLNTQKAGYLRFLKDIDKCFDLYGNGFDNSLLSSNIAYYGKKTPDELIRLMNGSFGLVWDGDSVDTCSGSYGEYLRINNPHKASLYLTAGMPVIVWKESAIAKFV